MDGLSVALTSAMTPSVRMAFEKAMEGQTLSQGCPSGKPSKSVISPCRITHNQPLRAPSPRQSTTQTPVRQGWCDGEVREGPGYGAVVGYSLKSWRGDYRVKMYRRELIFLIIFLGVSLYFAWPRSEFD